MKFPWSRKSEPEPPKTIQASLDSDRPDLNISLWLQDAFERHQKLPSEVENAYLADRFLNEMNSGGLEGLLTWEKESIHRMPQALLALQLHRPASELERILKSQEDNPEALENLAIESSVEIEQATHRYIRAHIQAFSALDP